MKNLNILFVLFLIAVFIIGLQVYLMMVKKICLQKENMENEKQPDASSDAPDNSCPDLLINKGNVILLYNTKQPEVDGVNPLPFYNLDEYINYLDIQRKKGKKCPVLYLQQETNTQGKDVYRMRPSPFDQQGGLPVAAAAPPTISPVVTGSPTMLNTSVSTDPNKPLPVVDASHSNPPYNAGNYAGFDAHGRDIGNYTELDKIHTSTSATTGISDNPMDLNWGGVLYTQQMINSGKYDDYNVYRPNYPTPKNTIYPDLYPEMNYPKV
jgi:hypothetical protein